MNPKDDLRLAPLRQVLDQLLRATQQWSRDGSDLDALTNLRHRALRSSHAHYVEKIPIYRRLAEDQGLLEIDDLDLLVNRMMVTDEVFKSYDPQWLVDGAFDRLTPWLGDRFVRRPTIDLEGIDTLQGWRDRLKTDGIYVSLSSGTSGLMSFVPRDRRTLQAMSQSGSSYYHAIWQPEADGSYGAFDVLVLGYRGKGLGLQAAGEGLAGMAARSHFLFDQEMTVDTIWQATGVGNSAPGLPDTSAEAQQEAFARSAAFLRRAADQDRRVVIFGAPFQLRALCNWLRAAVGRLPLTIDSLVISGGGWKRFDGQRIPPAALRQELQEALAVQPRQVIDTFSTAELNCVFMTCAEGLYHLPPLVEPVVLDDDLSGAIGTEGSGVLGILDPFAMSYPGFIITGDHVHLTRRDCACGLSGWCIEGEIRRAAGQEIKGCGGVMGSVTA